MKDVSTIILLMELQRRIKDFTGSDDDVFDNIPEESTQGLYEIVNLCLDEYQEVILQRTQEQS